MTKTPKPEIQPLDLNAIMATHAKTGTLWVKPCTFDFEHITVCAYALVMDDPETPWVLRFVTYNGRLSLKKPKELDYEDARPLAPEDVLPLLGKLEGTGYSVWRPEPVEAPEEPKKARRRKTAAE